MTSRRDVALMLLLTLLLIVNWTQECHAVDVGEAEDIASSSCPNVTTVSIDNSTTSSTVFITLGSTCKSSVVKVTTSSSGVKTLDLRSREIVEVVSLPAVNTVRLDNNQIRAFTTTNSISELYLANNSISTLDKFKFPSHLTVLDLANNAVGGIEKSKLPASIQYLTLSGNPIGSISTISFPSSLQQLDLVGSSVATLENFSFPGSVTTLNLSNNPITGIKGVIFPHSLAEFSLIATANPAATTTSQSGATSEAARALQTTDTTATSVLEEFEVRQSDADMFEKLSVWDVSPTSTLSCSDSNANPRYVQDTMLCVLSDSEFAVKYESVMIKASSNSTSGSKWGTNGSASQVAERMELKETLHQRRSWFLIAAAGLLSVCSIFMFTNAFCVCLRRKLRGSSNDKETQLKKTASGRSTHFWHENVAFEPDDEVRHLLFNPLTTTEENFIQPENEPDGNESVKKELNDPVTKLTEELEQWKIPESQMEHQELFSAAQRPETESGGSSSSFAYFKALYNHKTVLLKTLDTGNSRELSRFSEEIRLSCELLHPQLVVCYGFVKLPYVEQMESFGGDNVALVMEFMGKGDLNTFIQSHKKQTELKSQKQSTETQNGTNLLNFDAGDDEEEILQSDDEIPTITDHHKWSWRYSSVVFKSKLSIAIDIAQAIQYLHSFSPPLFHGNLSSRKVFIDNNWNVKLGDLMCCSALRRWSSAHQHTEISSFSTTGSLIRGSGRNTTSSQVSGEEVHMDMTVWTAPEVLDGRQYTQKADIYSFGVLLAQLATYECSSAEHSVMDDTEIPMLNNSQKDQLIDGEAPTPIQFLMLRCQAFQPEVRPTADELLEELQQIEQNLPLNF